MRLTYKALDQHGKETGTVWYSSSMGGSIFPKSDKEEEALKKLAAYEDTGMEPELVNNLKLSLFGTVAAEIAEEQGYVEVNRVAEIANAEAEGRLLILPCKVGDKVFRVVSKCLGATQCPFEGGYGLDRCYNCDAFIKEELFDFFMFKDVGKTVFLTREEAEALLEGEK